MLAPSAERKGDELARGGTATSLVFRAQEVTFLISILLQFLTIIGLSVAVAVSDGDKGEEDGTGHPITVILFLELAVGCVQFVWYSSIGLLYAAYDISTGVYVRYIDWFVTTPQMLAGVYLLLVHFAKPCATVAETYAAGPDGGLGIALAIIVVADCCMLILGVVVELDFLQISRLKLGRAPLWLGMLALGVAFVPHFRLLVDDEYGSSEGFWMTLSVLIVWALYGVVSLVFFDPTSENRAAKNAAFNILDLVSKNALGIVVTVIALSAETC